MFKHYLLFCSAKEIKFFFRSAKKRKCNLVNHAFFLQHCTNNAWFTKLNFCSSTVFYSTILQKQSIHFLVLQNKNIIWWIAFSFCDFMWIKCNLIEAKCLFYKIKKGNLVNYVFCNAMKTKHNLLICVLQVLPFACSTAGTKCSFCSIAKRKHNLANCIFFLQYYANEA